MQLVFEQSRARWEAITAFGEGDVPKAAGLQWDRDIKRWSTKSVAAANALRAHADAATAARLDAALLATQAADEARKAAVVATVALSRATDADIEIPAPAGLTYLGYQKAGIQYAMGRKGCLIADEPGLGKTIQALGVANSMLANTGKGRLSILIIGPKISLWNWRREAEKWLTAPHSVALWTAKKQDPADVIIVNYDVLTRPAVADALRARTWDLAVFDEAHALKSEKAARTRAVFGDRKKGLTALSATRRLFLTGTPILNRPVELYPMLHAMGLPEATTYYQYGARYCEGHHTDWGYDASGASNLPELQDVLRKSVMVRRLKADVLSELPAKRYSVIELEADTPALRACVNAEAVAQKALSAQEAKLKAQVTAARAGSDAEALKVAVAALSAGKRAAFQEMSHLRHETAVAKVPGVVEHLTALLDGSDESILVMAHHADVIADIVAGMAAAGHEAAVITGETSDAARQAAQDDIQSRRKRLFVGSMRACGVAITLTAASTVVFAEQDWVPGIMSQAEDRAHRIGQHSQVLVQHLVVDGSFDSTMAKSVAEKGGVIDAALDDVVDEDDQAAREAGAAQERAAEAQRIDQAVQEAARKAREAADRQASVAAEVAERKARAARSESALAGLYAWTADSVARLGLALTPITAPARAVDPRADAVARATARAEESLGSDIELPEEQVAAIHAALKHIASHDQDWASERNEIGYSQSDTSAGHYLAEQAALGPRDAVLGLHLVRRYRRQLPSSLLAAALGEPSAPVVLDVNEDFRPHGDGKLVIQNGDPSPLLEQAHDLPEATKMATMTHLKCHDLENDTRWTDKLTPKKNTFERLALHHVRDMDNYVQPGAHGIDGPQLAVTAVYTDGTEADVTVDFIRAGWRRWLEGDEYEYLDAVPLTHVSRRRRLEAFCAQGDEPTAEQEAELAAARLAELADMDREETRTRPVAHAAPATAPDAPAAMVEPAVPLEPELVWD